MENFSVVMQLGLTMAGCIVLCLFAGRFLDRLIGTKGVFITILTLFGVFGGANVVYRQILEITEENEITEEKKKNLDGE